MSTADNLFMLRRNDEEKEQQRSWVIIRKARSSGGDGAKIPLFWNGRTQRMGDGDHDLFVKENPQIFGEQSKKLREQEEKKNDKISNDAVAQALGVPDKKPTTDSKKKKEALSVRENLKRKLNRGKTDD